MRMLKRVKVKVKISLKILIIFLSFVNLYVVQKNEKVKLCIYKLSSDNKILSSLIKKAWCTCTFLNNFREANQQLLCALFL